MKKNYRSRLLFVILFLFLIFYLFHASFMIKEFLDYSFLLLTKLLPVSFPLFIFTSLLIEYGLLDFIPYHDSSIMIFLLSLLCGFPSGSKYIKDLYSKKIISEDEGNSMLFFSHFPNPLFVLGSVTLAIDSKVLAYKIFFAIFCSNLILLILFKGKRKYYPKNESLKPFSNVLAKTIFSASQTILIIYGTSLFFFFLLLFFTYYLRLSPFLYVFLCGLFDITKGVFASTIFHSIILRSYFVLFFLSFGSISIHIQIKSILVDTSLSYQSFFKGRILGTIISFFLFTLFIINELLQL